MRVIGYSGVPATGKTTLMKAFIDRITEGGRRQHEEIKWGTVRAQAYPWNKILILGTYAAGEPFGGTDRLPMNVQPLALAFLAALSQNPQWKDWTVLFEGDRLFNGKFLASLQEELTGTDFHFFLLTAGAGALDTRHALRNDTQTETWLKGRVTKVERLKKEFRLFSFQHDTPEQTQAMVNYLIRWIQAEPAVAG